MVSGTGKAARRARRRQKKKGQSKSARNNSDTLDIDEFIKGHNENKARKIEQQKIQDLPVDNDDFSGSDDEEIDRMMAAARDNDGKTETS